MVRSAADAEEILAFIRERKLFWPLTNINAPYQRHLDLSKVRRWNDVVAVTPNFEQAIQLGDVADPSVLLGNAGPAFWLCLSPAELVLRNGDALSARSRDAHLIHVLRRAAFQSPWGQAGVNGIAAIRSLDFLRQAYAENPTSGVIQGVSRKKYAMIAPFLRGRSGIVKHLPSGMHRNDEPLFVWGNDQQPLKRPNTRGVIDESAEPRVFRVEDGFLRSVGLGLLRVPPLSLVVDRSGLYLDPSRPSDLETLLNTRRWSTQDLQRAGKLRRSLIDLGLTKYNVESSVEGLPTTTDKKRILVPGQVENDASHRYGSPDIKTNLGM